jgi:hypothetical protein
MKMMDERMKKGAMTLVRGSVVKTLAGDDEEEENA